MRANKYCSYSLWYHDPTFWNSDRSVKQGYFKFGDVNYWWVKRISANSGKPFFQCHKEIAILNCFVAKTSYIYMYMYIAVLDSNIRAILISPAGSLGQERPLTEIPHPQARGARFSQGYTRVGRIVTAWIYIEPHIMLQLIFESSLAALITISRQTQSHNERFNLIQSRLW